MDLEVKEANYQMVNKMEKSLEKLNNRQLQILCIWNSKCEQISWITKGFSKDLKEYLNSLNIGLHKEFDLTFNFDKLFYQRKDMRPNKHKRCESTMRAIHNWATVQWVYLGQHQCNTKLVEIITEIKQDFYMFTKLSWNCVNNQAWDHQSLVEIL